jgi:hypothetical protein
VVIFARQDLVKFRHTLVLPTQISAGASDAQHDDGIPQL